jgi:hypothetical protein
VDVHCRGISLRGMKMSTVADDACESRKRLDRFSRH